MMCERWWQHKMDFTITSGQILWFLGFIGAMWTTYKIYKELRRPNDDKIKMLLEHAEMLENLDKRLQAIETTDKLQLQGLLVAINHDIMGNGIEQLKEYRSVIQEYLINK